MASSAIPILDSFIQGDGAPPGLDMFDDHELEPDNGVSGNVTNAGAADESDDDENARGTPDTTGPIPGGGELLEEEDPAKVFKAIDDEVKRQRKLARNRDEMGKHWDRVRSGVPFSILDKSEDQSVWQAMLPPGVEDKSAPIANKVDDLCNKQVSQILVDPFLPDPKADGDSDRSRGAMDLAKRWLRADGDSSGTNDDELFREALTVNRTRASAFIYQWVDATGGGWRPKQKKAHPQAQDAANPLVGPDGQKTADPILRYVSNAGGKEVFVESAAQASRQWIPKHRAKVLPPNQVRVQPPLAKIADANAIILLLFEPLSEVRRLFPDVINGMNKAQLRELARWRPPDYKRLLPDALRNKSDGLDGQELSDDRLVFWYHKFCKISPDYPDGAEIAVSGASPMTDEGGDDRGVLLLRDTLRDDVEGEDGQLVPVLREPPIAQFRAYIDTKGGDGMGKPPISAFGGANENRAHIYLSVLEDIDVRLHPNVFMPGGSAITKEDMNRRDGSNIDIVSRDDIPTFETRPPMPAYVEPMIDRIEHEMDTAANLNQTAQALDSRYSDSGEAKKVAIRQARTQLAQDYQGCESGVTSFWRQKLQLAQAKMPVPQLVGIAGEGSAFKSRYFVGADLLGISAVAKMSGSGTMMAPAEKAQFLQTMQSNQWLDPQSAGTVARAAMSDDLGLPPDPHEERIDREIADWIEGPSPQWLQAAQAAQQYPAELQAYQTRLQQMAGLFIARGIDQQSAMANAQRLAGAPPQPPPAPSTVFIPRPNDEEPIVAKVRYTKLSHLASTTEYSKQPALWRKQIDDEYQRMAYAAGVQTVKQQAQAAQQAQTTKAGNENAPPTWQEFIADATAQVVSVAAKVVAQDVAGLEANKNATPPAPAPEQPDSPVPTHEIDLRHESMENQRDRAHALQMEQLKHANATTQLSMKQSGDRAAQGDRLAQAERQAQRDAMEPGPMRSDDTTAL